MADQLRSGGDGKKEEAGILLTRGIVVQDPVVPVPMGNTELNQLAPSKDGEGNQVPILQVLQNGKSLVLEPQTEPLCQFTEPAHPLSGINGIADAVDPLVRCTEVCIP